MTPEPLVALGYLLVRPLPRHPFFSADLLPGQLISASDCICPRFPGEYAIDWCSMSDEQRAKKFGAIEIPAERQPAAREWATRTFGQKFGWPSTFYSTSAAVEARRSFVPAHVDVRLIGLALPATALDTFLAHTAPLEPTEGFSPEGESGYFTMAKRREQLEPGGRMLGFEALNIELRQVTHSWLCNQLETHCAAALGIRPNAAGFIETLEDAQRCCDEISREEVGSEPGPWLPFALVEYEFPR